MGLKLIVIGPYEGCYLICACMRAWLASGMDLVQIGGNLDLFRSCFGSRVVLDQLWPSSKSVLAMLIWPHGVV